MYPVVTLAVLPTQYFHILEFMDVAKLIDIRGCYKIYYVAEGSSAIRVNNRQCLLVEGDVGFYRPGDMMTLEAGGTGYGYLCLVHTEYLSTDSAYLLDLFRHFPLYPPHPATIALDNTQSAIVRIAFESMIIEQKSDHPDKKQATVLHLQMILLQIQRAGRLIGQVKGIGKPEDSGCVDLCSLFFS